MQNVKKILLGAVAVLALSGCTAEDLIALTKVDILDLTKGYEIVADGSKGKQVVIEFCDNRYIYYRGGSEVERGDYYVGSDGIITNNRVNMTPDPGGSERIDADEGYLHVGRRYDVVGVESIDIYDINTISCL